MTAECQTEENPQTIRSPRGGRPTREAATELGTHILDVALQHFFRHGFESAHMDAIAAEAHVSKRTLYQRYESKKGLLLAVRERERQDFIAIVDTPLPEGSVRERLLILALTILHALLTPRVRAFMKLRDELERLMPDFDDGTAEMVMGHWVNAFRAILASEAVCSPDRLDAVASFLFDTLVTLPHARIETRRVVPDTPEARLAEIERLLDLVAEGLPFLQQQRAMPAAND